MLRDFLDKIDIDHLADLQKLTISHIANHVSVFNDEEDPDFEQYDLALIGIPLDYENPEETNCSAAPDVIRQQFLQLFNWENSLRLIDLGNIRQGESPMDTYHALSVVIRECCESNVVPIILGGTHDFAFGQYMGHGESGGSVNVATIDERIDLRQPDEEIDSQSFLFNILAHQPNYLGEYFQIGYQNYLVDPMTVDTLNKLNFECHRLGYIRRDMRRFEPLIRDANMVSVDLSAIRYSDAPAQRFASPNGLLPEEACKLARYAGISDNVRSFGLYECFIEKDTNGVSAQLIAQMIWHFIDGYYARKNERPYEYSKDYVQYVVELDVEGHDIHFIKSLKSERWWMKLPLHDPENDRPYRLIPCTEEEYLEAVAQEIPDRWVNAFLKYSTAQVKTTR